VETRWYSEPTTVIQMNFTTLAKEPYRTRKWAVMTHTRNLREHGSSLIQRSKYGTLKHFTTFAKEPYWNHKRALNTHTRYLRERGNSLAQRSLEGSSKKPYYTRKRTFSHAHKNCEHAHKYCKGTWKFAGTASLIRYDKRALLHLRLAVPANFHIPL